MTTPADLAANEARIARRNARLQGIREGKAVDPAPTTPAHVHAIRREAEIAQAQAAADAAEQRDEQARAAHRAKRSSSSRSKKAAA